MTIATHPIGGSVSAPSLNSIKRAAADQSPIQGLTHGFYRYPARFSPLFVASAIEAFTDPGDTVLDPYMGGGTTIVEAMARGRVAIGCDLNSLAVFIAKAKTTPLQEMETQRVLAWISETVPNLSYHTVSDEIAELVCFQRTRNLHLPRARPVKKLIALAILSLKELPTLNAQNFARCILLNVAQWALNNRKAAPSLRQVREKLRTAAQNMLGGLDELSGVIKENKFVQQDPTFIHGTAADLLTYRPFTSGRKADLVVTSPPYPGIHILYHRWQVDGRKETPAPYWIANCHDGKGSSFYNFADRKEDAQDDYFDESLRTLRAVRSVISDNAVMVQMIAFSQPRTQLLRYLRNMQLAGFEEIREVENGDAARRFRRIWRPVPGRAWYANLKGTTCSSREVVLLHRAV